MASKHKNNNLHGHNGEASTPGNGCGHRAQDVHRLHHNSHGSESSKFPVQRYAQTEESYCKGSGRSSCHEGRGEDRQTSQSAARRSTNASEEELSPRTNRRQLRELMAAEEDCWDTNLSDDDSPQKLPLEWEAGMVRRQMNRSRRNLGDPPGNFSPGSNGEPTPAKDNDALFPEDDDATASNYNESEMSLPEQLLRNRLLRKQRLQKKHDLFVKYQQNGQVSPPNSNKKKYSQDNFNFLSGSTTGSNGRSQSPLFPDDIEDDNVSIVASSNGSTPQPPQFYSPNKQSPNKQQINSPTSPLDSLPQRPIVPLPDEADRKRVVGCLAAVLASSYSYETVPHLMVKKKTVVGATHSIVAQEESESAKEQLWHTDEPMHQQYLSQNQSKQPAKSAASPKNRRNNHKLQHAHSMGEFRPFQSTSSSKPRLNFQNSFSPFSFNNSSSQNPPSQLTAELAEIRHRIRRHAVLSELLVSSAEMLLLDPSHARAFLPMLEGLLTSAEEKEGQSNNAPSKKESWKGRGFGGGGVHAGNMHMDGTMSVHGMASCFRDNRMSTASRKSNSAHGTPSPPLVRSEMASRGAKPVPPFAPPTLKSEDHSTKSHAISHTSEPAIQLKCSPSIVEMPCYSPLDTIIVEKENISPFLETMTPGAGFRCIALLLLNHLLRDGRGYDARVRQAFKRLAVVILSHELKVGGILRVDLEDDEDLDAVLWGDRETSEEREEFDDAEELALLATRKFEAMEHAIAAKLIAMSRISDKNSSAKRSQRSNSSSASNTNDPLKQLTDSSTSVSHGRIALAPKETPPSSQHGISREQWLRGLKIGTAGAVGATLFALTGGLAAPGIAAGLAAVAGGSAVAAGVTTVLSSAAAISTIFGVGGAGLAGYKMHRRTKGLTEFDFQKEGMSKSNEAELFSTVCISGWLRDSRDFQRPWGVSPSHPRIVDKQELLERFYFIHNPENVQRCQKIIKHWKGRHFQLWKALHQKYGTDPSNLFPLKEGPRISAELTHEEREAIALLLNELGYSNETEAASPFRNHDSPTALQTRSSPPEARKLQSTQNQIRDSLTSKKGLLENFGVKSADMSISTISSNLSLFEEDSQVKQSNSDDASTRPETPSSTASTKESKQLADPKPEKSPAPPKHLLTVWDYNANYGGELYTVKWESNLLMELCDSVTDQMIEWGISGTKTILHTTVFATLMTAVTIPYSLAMASNVIDDTWTMAMERADRAGVELAKSLIDSSAGHRPVVLVGFSMGARVIYSCLKELTRQQELWEDEQQRRGLPATSGRLHNSRRLAQEKLQYIREPASIIEDAIMMGMPNHVSLKSWESSRRVVAGRLINCFSRKDMILSLMFQLKRMQGILRPVCGTSPVVVNGVENFDVTDLVSAHTDYCLVTGEILKRVRHGQPQRASISETELAPMVTTINVNYGVTPLSDETVPNMSIETNARRRSSTTK